MCIEFELVDIYVLLDILDRIGVFIINIVWCYIIDFLVYVIFGVFKVG